MEVQVVKHINHDENDRIEFLLVNYDFYDGNDLVAKLFCREYQMSADDKFDGMYYSIIRLHKGSAEYDLVWHEDVGNYVYCLQQDKAAVDELEHRLKFVIGKINEMLSGENK